MAARLQLVANLWTMIGHPSSDREWTVAEKIGAAKEAGFDALTGDLGRDDMARIVDADMTPIGFFVVQTEQDAEEGVRRLASWGVRWATVFLGSHDTPPEVTLGLALRLDSCASEAGLHAAVETHRNTGTETIEKMIAVIQGFRERTGRELPVTWDFSHYALGKHLEAQEWRERLVVPFRESILQARLFHFRPFNGHHCQLPVRIAGKRTPEYEAFLGFTAAIFEVWRSEPDNIDTLLYACPEMGPKISGYALSHEDSPWLKAVILASDLRALWL